MNGSLHLKYVKCTKYHVHYVHIMIHPDLIPIVKLAEASDCRASEIHDAPCGMMSNLESMSVVSDTDHTEMTCSYL